MLTNNIWVASMTHNDRLGSLRRGPSINCACLEFAMYLYSRCICICVFLLEVWLVCSGQCEMESQRHIVGSPIVSNLQPANTQAGCWIHRLFVFYLKIPCCRVFVSLASLSTCDCENCGSCVSSLPKCRFFHLFIIYFFHPLNITCPYT